MTTSLGYPRIGAGRELKWLLENYWAERTSAAELGERARALVADNLRVQRDCGLDCLPVGDFSLYDHVLDLSVALGVVPKRFRLASASALERYFLMARGRAPGVATELAPLEMTKWFDTNYHYLVPEIGPETSFEYVPSALAEHFTQGLELGHPVRPVLIGPVTFLRLAKGEKREPLGFSHLQALLPAYEALLQHLVELGADWVQLDEPCLSLDLDEATRSAYREAYRRLGRSSAKLLVTTYFAGLGDNASLALELPVHGLHIDGLAAPEDITRIAQGIGRDRVLSLGLVDGRNVWRSDLERALELGERALSLIGSERLWIAPTCSLLHVPVELENEPALDAELAGWLAFARQKLLEIGLIRRGLEGSRAAIREELELSRRNRRARLESPRTRNTSVRAALAAVKASDECRATPARERLRRQREVLKLPLLPTTTIGSFPQTPELRQLRAQHRAGRLDEAGYQRALESAVDTTLQTQEELGLDVLVHGEAERTDMVEYFGAALSGMAVTESGWVQSYGSRCVKPPIIFGDVRREGPITVAVTSYAQRRTQKPVKGMLTGPVTLLKWSFVRDDEPLAHTARTLALALRAELAALESAGISVIQVDEPAFREALPLRQAERAAYLAWAVAAFRLATSGVRDTTQIHTHMCYSEFGDVMAALRALDADVISIESARSAMDLLNSFSGEGYVNDIGLGVYDIHSPRVPSVSEMLTHLRHALRVLEPAQVWVNPDCGLKTRAWDEVIPALRNMVQAAVLARAELAALEAKKAGES
jgi:5-methyltetrahydropteroyltriglutamate--homocysteine methyltransferase